MSYPIALHNYYSVTLEHIKTIDIRDDSFVELKANYLETELNHKSHVMILIIWKGVFMIVKYMKFSFQKERNRK